MGEVVRTERSSIMTVLVDRDSRVAPGASERRCLGLAALSVITLLCCGTLRADDRGYPVTPDDLKFAQTLIEQGFSDMGAGLYKRLYEAQGSSEAVKREAGQGLLDAYLALALEVVEPVERDRYIQQAAKLVDDLVKPYPEGKVPLELVCKRAEVIQLYGRSLSVGIKPPPAGEQPDLALIKQCEDRFDNAIKLFVEVQNRALAEEKVLGPDPEKNSGRLQELKELRTKSALKLS